MRTINNFDIEENSPMVFKRCADQSYRFVLRKYSGSGSKLRCPRCGRKSFTPYIDTQTNEILDENVGICDHKNSCGYHFTPREYFGASHTGNYGEAVRGGKRKNTRRFALIARAARTGSHPHKKEEYFPKHYNTPQRPFQHFAKNNINNQSISVKHHQNTLNNQQLSVQYFNKSKNQDISTTKFVSEKNKRQQTTKRQRRKKKIKLLKTKNINQKEC